jgi:hypothetical protein
MFGASAPSNARRARHWRRIQAAGNSLVFFWRFIMAKEIIQAITANDIDNLGVLLADISRLTKQADEIKTRLKAGGLDSYDGEVFRAVVVKQDRTSYDPRKVEALLGDLITQVEQVSKVTSVKVTARKA